jgi:hypothetical protein
VFEIFSMITLEIRVPNDSFLVSGHRYSSSAEEVCSSAEGSDVVGKSVICDVASKDGD